MMLHKIAKYRHLIAIGYILAVVICIVMAFDFDGSIHFEWTLVLIALTLPWSIVSVFFAWALIHGAGLEMFTVIYLASAGINALILNWLGKKAMKQESAKVRGGTSGS